MNGPVRSSVPPRRSGIPLPTFLRAIARPLSLLPGEDPTEFNVIRDTVIEEIAPQSAIEWLWTYDLVELSWDIQRYRSLRHKVLEAHRQRAIEELLHRIDSVGIPSRSREMARCQAQRNAEEWRDDPNAAIEIEVRLASYGFDAVSMDMEVIVQARELFIMFDNLMHSAQNRRILLLREINGRRRSTERIAPPPSDRT